MDKKIRQTVSGLVAGAMMLALGMAAIYVSPAAAHSAGGLDLIGCHEKEAKGKTEYHCHKGPLAGMTFANKTEAQKALKKKKGK